MKPGPELDAAVQAALVKLCNEPIWPACFSTDWAAAGQALERLVEKFKLMSIKLYPIDDGRWACDLHFPNWIQHSAVGIQGPHAICLAALAAMKEKDEDLAYHAAVHNPQDSLGDNDARRIS